MGRCFGFGRACVVCMRAWVGDRGVRVWVSVSIFLFLLVFVDKFEAWVFIFVGVGNLGLGVNGGFSRVFVFWLVSFLFYVLLV